MVWFVVLAVLVVIVSLATREAEPRGRSRRREPPASKYDANPMLANAEYRTRLVARLEQRDRTGEGDEWDDDEDTADDAGEPVASVVVARMDDPSEAHLLRGALLAAGIPVAPIPVDWPNTRPPYGPLGVAREIIVPADRADEARRLITDLRASWE